MGQVDDGVRLQLADGGAEGPVPLGCLAVTHDHLDVLPALVVAIGPLRAPADHHRLVTRPTRLGAR